MAELTIKGHATRGREVIELLEMLGGKNDKCYCGRFFNHIYFINENGYIESCDKMQHLNYIQLSLEEFLEKFPYKVGDKVIYHETNAIVSKMKWDGKEIVYIVECKKEWWETTGFYLQPYKEETMEEPKELLIGFIKDENGNMELNTHKDYEIKEVNGKFMLLKKKPQYPKAYRECFNICFGNYHHIIQVVGLDGLGNNRELFENFIKLKICRDAYWKIAGKQMELDKSWEPDWSNIDQDKYVIEVVKNTITLNTYPWNESNHLLAFPTEEMRDAFYKNFKELIKQCKELL